MCCLVIDYDLCRTDDLYLGSENTLLLEQMYTIAFTCQFQLQFYPFDSQVCSLVFNLLGVSPSFVTLLKVGNGEYFFIIGWYPRLYDSKVKVPPVVDN